MSEKEKILIQNIILKNIMVCVNQKYIIISLKIGIDHAQSNCFVIDTLDQTK